MTKLPKPDVVNPNVCASYSYAYLTRDTPPPTSNNPKINSKFFKKKVEAVDKEVKSDKKVFSISKTPQEFSSPFKILIKKFRLIFSKIWKQMFSKSQENSTSFNVVIESSEID